MLYPIFASVFFLTILICLLLIVGLIFKPKFWRSNLKRIQFFCVLWFIPYFIFICFFTGPKDIRRYPPQKDSPYKLPWKAGVTRFVPQGNRSFTSHRGLFLYAWDFLMPTGTEILAARGGRIVEVLDSHDGIGLISNFVTVEHNDGTHAIYAHIRYQGSLVRVGDRVVQGQPIALSGMVGQAPGPHLHFAVLNKEKTESIPISFSDVPGGIPFAGHFYTSGNDGR
jgi:murein DD-endopeptidase MepM/ murein hydrolase activator NlpD